MLVDINKPHGLGYDSIDTYPAFLRLPAATIIKFESPPPKRWGSIFPVLMVLRTIERYFERHEFAVLMTAVLYALVQLVAFVALQRFPHWQETAILNSEDLQATLLPGALTGAVVKIVLHCYNADRETKYRLTI